MSRKLQGRLGPVVFASAVAAMIASGCAAVPDDGPGTDYVAVCTDKAGNRVDDSNCGHAPQVYDNDSFDASDAFLWYYLGTANSAAYAPGIGQRVTGGVWRTPVSVRNTTININSGNSGSTTKQTVQRGGVPSKGGSITRGGFGVSSGSSGSGSSSKSGGGSGSSSSGGRSSSGSSGS